MKRVGLIFIFYILYVSLMCAQGNGTYFDFELGVDGMIREYTLYVPEGHDGNEPWPLVFLFHGFSTTFEEQRDISQMYLVADTAKFLIAYPQGLNVYQMNVDRTEIGWNVPGFFHEKQDDVLFVSKTIDDLITNPSINIDLRRVHSTGYSLGGYFSFYLALELSNRIASISSVAGILTDTLINYICEPVRNISVLHIYGTDDQVNINACNNLCMSPIDISEYWADVNECYTIPDSAQLEDIDSNDNSTVTLFDYTDCNQETEVKYYRINGGGHTWPGGWIDPSWASVLGALNQDINANVEMWNFFKRNPHPDPWIEIPDTAFLHALADEGVDINEDSIIYYEEAEAITNLDVSLASVSDMTGIEGFYNLEELICNGNQLTSLDLSNNTALTSLNCQDNQLTTLDVSNNTALEYLNISDMPTLHEVCVWEIPFPPAGVEVDTIGSPNVCFITDCNEECEITEIEEYKKEVISIFPNPSNDIINIVIENTNSITIEIFDVMGRLLYNKVTNLKTEKIDISSYTTGIYLIKVKQVDRIYIEKLVVR